MDTATVTARDATVAVAPAAIAQLEAIRDQWLRPLMERNEELARENGRLAVEREAAIRERDDLAARLAGDRGLADQLVDVLQAERDALAARVRALEADRAGEIVSGPQEAPPEAPGPPPPAGATPDTSPPAPSRWRRWVRAVVGS